MASKSLKRIYLVRHGETTANVDLTCYNETPDFAIELTSKGIEQAKSAGEFLKQTITCFPPQATRIFYSPYKRTIQTTAAILDVMGKDFVKKQIKGILENDRLREQNFGDFDGIASEERIRLNPKYAQYLNHDGEYWGPVPNGENRHTVCNRVHGVFGTIHRDASFSGIKNIIIISHGLTVRAFIKEWCHLSWDQLEHSSNPSNCSIQLIDGTSGRYELRENVFVVDKEKTHPVFPNTKNRFAQYQP